MDMWSTRPSTFPTPSVRLHGGRHSQSQCRAGTSPGPDVEGDEAGLCPELPQLNLSSLRQPIGKAFGVLDLHKPVILRHPFPAGRSATLDLTTTRPNR